MNTQSIYISTSGGGISSITSPNSTILITYSTTTATVDVDVSHSNIWTPTNGTTFSRNGIITTKTNSLIISNSTAATSGVPIQYSPSLYMEGREFNTTSHPFGFRCQVKPSNGDRGSISWDVNRNGVFTNDLMSLDHSGGLTLIGSLKSTGIQLLDNSANTITINPASSITPYVLTMPAVQGTSNTSLINDGAGNLSWGQKTYEFTNQTVAGSTGIMPLTVDAGFTKVISVMLHVTSTVPGTEHPYVTDASILGTIVTLFLWTAEGTAASETYTITITLQ